MPRPAADPGERREVRASREVILCGGAFNTPQLLKLSGIGPRQELAQHGIDVRVDLPGVGANLQDRYEVSVVYRMREDWSFMKAPSSGIPQRRRLFPPVGESARRSLRHQRRHVCRDQEVAPGSPFAGFVLSKLVDPFRRLLSRLLKTHFGASGLSHLDRFESAHGEPRGDGDFAIHRSARSAAHQLSLFRRRQRPGRRGSCRRGRRGKIRAAASARSWCKAATSPRNTCPAIAFKPTRSLVISFVTTPGAIMRHALAPSERKKRAAS